MKALATKRFVLRAGSDTFVTAPLIIQDIPDRFTRCKMFELACADGDIQTLHTSSEQSAAANEPGEPTRSSPTRKPKHTDSRAAHDGG